MATPLSVHEACTLAQHAAKVRQQDLLDYLAREQLVRLELEGALARARREAEAALERLRASDEPRLWVLSDEEEPEPPTTVLLRPSEVEARLEEEVRGNFADVREPRQIKACAHCELTGETVEVSVAVQPQRLDD